MAIFSHIDHPLTFTFGILGNIVSFMVYLAPAPTFYKIIKKKSTDGYQSIPYVVALFSSMIWIYYATLKTNATLLITINAVGCVIESIYISIYIVYAPKNIKIQTTKLVLSLNFVGFLVIALTTHYLAEGSIRAQILGWICLVLSISVFVAPLTIMKTVIRTKSVEFMPFGLSFFLVLSAVMWFFYGLLQKDIFIALPNIIGFVLGVLQMVLYMVYKNYNKKNINLEHKLPTSISTISNAIKHDEPKYAHTKNQTITIECTRGEDIGSQAEEPPLIMQPIDYLIKDVMKEDMVLKASTSCALGDQNQMKYMDAPNRVNLIESAA